MKYGVLFSGGVDSTVVLADAIEMLGKDDVVAVSIDYNQTNSRELEAVKALTEHYDVKSYRIDLSEVFKGISSSLISDSEYKSIEGRPDTYVPFRNGIFLSVAAAKLMSIYPEEPIAILIGTHEENRDIACPDDTYEFCVTMSRAIGLGTYDMVRIIPPLINMTKADVVKRGIELNVPFNLTWSCYNGGEKACGKCGTCRDRLEAFRKNGAKDPIEYEEE